jgi:hypothetical protein
MFYRQCNNCNERWELGTTNICTCVTNGSATISYDKFSHLGQRTWVGLTDEDRFELAKAQYGWEDLLFAAEAKLRSKNHEI